VVKVLFHSSVKELTNGQTSYDPEKAKDVSGLIDELGLRFGDPFREFLLGNQTCFILVNGSGLMKTGGYDTPLKSGDTIEILPFVTEG